MTMLLAPTREATRKPQGEQPAEEQPSEAAAS